MRANSQNLRGKPPNYFVKWIATLISLARNDGNGLSPKFFFIAGIIFNLSLLGFFKYTDFLLENFNAFSKLAHLDFNIPLPHILLPLALSFVTFQQIAFLFDCFKRAKGELSENLNIDFIDYALFISFFPQLIAGPIVHHREMMPQFSRLGRVNSSSRSDFLGSASARFVNEPKSSISSLASHNPKNSSTILEFTSCKNAESALDSATRTKSAESNKNSPSLAEGARGWVDSTINYEFLAKGIFIFSIGLFKKVFIADSFAKWTNAGFGIVEKGGFLNLAESWATSLSYTFQLYFDFSGYCDMAMGLALMFGIVLPLNFSSPYKSLNISEFWRRWHITLGRFLRECLYIPLGGNKVAKILNLRNLFIVAFLSGLWHGAGWGFVIWGILHGSAMVIHRIYSWWLRNSSLGASFALGENFGEQQTHKSSFIPKISSKYKTSTANTRICDLDSAKQAKIAESALDSANRAKNTKFHFTQTRFYKILCWLLTFNFINLAWVFFRAENLNGAMSLIKGMFGFSSDFPQKWSKAFSALQVGTNEILIWLICAFILCLGFKNTFEMVRDFKVPYFRFCAVFNIFNKRLVIKCGAIFARFVLTIALFYISIWIMLSNLLIANTYTPFLYFNF